MPRLLQKKPVTLQDIADRLGLTKRAVSQALNDRKATVKVSAATREKVQALAKELGYRYNTAARSLATGRTGFFGILGFQGLMHQGTVQTLAAIHEFQKVGITPLTIQIAGSSIGSCDRAVDSALDARLDGAIIIAKRSMQFSQSHVRRLREHGVALVGVGAGHLPGVPVFMPAVAEGYAMATTHLIESGYRSIKLLHSATKPSGKPAEEGFRAAIRKAKREGKPIVFNSESLLAMKPASLAGIHDLYAEGYVGMWELIRKKKVPEAIVCQVDGWAMGALRACAEAGLRVPDDVAIVGYGDDPSSSAGPIPITTVAEPTGQLFHAAVARLIATVREHSATEESVITMPCRLVVRQSSSRQRLPRPIDALDS